MVMSSRFGEEDIQFDILARNNNQFPYLLSFIYDLNHWKRKLYVVQWSFHFYNVIVNYIFQCTFAAIFPYNYHIIVHLFA